MADSEVVFIPDPALEAAAAAPAPGEAPAQLNDDPPHTAESRVAEGKLKADAAKRPAVPPKKAERPARVTSRRGVPHRRVGDETEQAPKPHTADELFEVMVDHWGIEPMFEKGDLLHGDEIPYDMDWALQLAVIRPRPDLKNTSFKSTKEIQQ